MSNLERQIKSFYDGLHSERSRSRPPWLSSYYSLFESPTLELGSGTLVPENRPGTLVVCVDFSRTATESLHGQGATTVQADAANLPFKDATFKTVACHDLLEHVTSVTAVLREMARVSARRVVIAGPNYVGRAQFRKRFDVLRHSLLVLLGKHRRPLSLDNPHLRYDDSWSKDADAVSAVNAWWVEHELSSHGFDVVSLSTYFGASKVGTRLLSRVFPFRYAGPFMCVVADRRRTA